MCFNFIYITFLFIPFSYKRGLPRSIDMVFDCRFLTNPYWVSELRPLNGTDRKVQDHVAADVYDLGVRSDQRLRADVVADVDDLVVLDRDGLSHRHGLAHGADAGLATGLRGSASTA